MELRIGHGFDVHRFQRGRKLILGGVEIPHDRGLAGYSDADALLHALINAILGALGAGDIGTHFPDSDPQYKNVASSKLLN
ncbi:MAG TPA: 2-C-methyl-D-erythritol 2,4-cyclodiphosphate synthase, partial [Candidatus Binatia bacterium]|nr:2-C-methyl-D-erythritol 2,4-cyclodiphosphate synthase [Candidatus Binatia bacterium]